MQIYFQVIILKLYYEFNIIQDLVIKIINSLLFI